MGGFQFGNQSCAGAVLYAVDGPEGCGVGAGRVGWVRYGGVGGVGFGAGVGGVEGGVVGGVPVLGCEFESEGVGEEGVDDGCDGAA